MKVAFKGKIGSITRPRKSETFRLDDEMVSLGIDLSGLVANETARSARLNGTLQLKPLIADRLRFGSLLTITIEDDSETETELTEADVISSVVKEGAV